MNTFKLHWRSGEVEIVKGEDIATAFTMAGYSAGAIRALDWWEEAGEDNQKGEENGTEG